MEDTPRLPSERSFGLLFAAVGSGFAAWSWYAGRSVLAVALLVLALVCLTLALAAPRYLAWPNRLWFRLGMALNAVVSPVVLFVMFALMFVPIALVMRIMGRDPLKRRGHRPIPSSNNSRNATMSFLKELWDFLKARKKLWLLPIILGLVVLGGLLILAQGSVVAPFIYTLF